MGRRETEKGVARGCCLGLALALLPVVAVVLLLSRALASPDLGAPPMGPGHGGTPEAIAAVMVAKVGLDLVAAPHATFTLSESDLTVITAAKNPDPDRYHEIHARIRGGLVVIDAATGLGPFGTVTTARLSVAVVSGGQGPRVTAQVEEVDLGQLTLPQWAWSNFDSRGAAAFNLDGFLGDPAAKVLRATIDCVRPVPGGLVLGFHRPGIAADPGACGS